MEDGEREMQQRIFSSLSSSSPSSSHLHLPPPPPPPLSPPSPPQDQPDTGELLGPALPPPEGPPGPLPPGPRLCPRPRLAGTLRPAGPGEGAGGEVQLHHPTRHRAGQPSPGPTDPWGQLLYCLWVLRGSLGVNYCTVCGC